jgi:ketosteroid isomerase-like protein
MKKLLLFITITIITTLHAKAQDAQAILKVIETQRQAWNRGDVAGYMQGYWQSDSLTFIGKKGPDYGWQTTLNHYKKGYPNKDAMGQLTFHIIKVNQLDAKNAFVIGAWNIKRAKDAPGGYFTLLFKKIKGEWKIVVDHTS